MRSVSPSSAIARRATGVTDRGQRSVVAYDDRGNAVWGARQMALPAEAGSYEPTTGQTGPVPEYVEGAEIARPSAFDALHTYVRTATFDHAGRGMALFEPAVHAAAEVLEVVGVDVLVLYLVGEDVFAQVVQRRGLVRFSRSLVRPGRRRRRRFGNQNCSR